MTGELLAIGVDPGPMPGIVALRWSVSDSGVALLEGVEIIQCTPGIAPSIVRELLVSDSHPDLRAVVQLERFVVGKTSMKAARAGAVTRDLVGEVQREVQLTSRTADGHDAVATQQNAARVKHWATDARLMHVQKHGSDLYRLTAGVRHARDAARHALFASCHDGGVPDPLSKTTNHRGARA